MSLEISFAIIISKRITIWGTQLIKKNIFFHYLILCKEKKKHFFFATEISEFRPNFLLLLHKVYQTCGTGEDKNLHFFYVKETEDNSHEEKIQRG